MSSSKEMKLVFFLDAIEHVSRYTLEHTLATANTPPNILTLSPPRNCHLTLCLTSFPASQQCSLLAVHTNTSYEHC